MASQKLGWSGTTLQGRRWLMEQRMEAVEQNDSTRLKELLEYSPLPSLRELTSALGILLLKRQKISIECMQLLLDKGADPCGKSGNGTPFVVLASEAGYHEVLALLIAAGSDVTETRTADGASSLHRAIWNGHIECVDILISNKSDLNMVDCQGRSPLLLAAQAEEVEIIRKITKLDHIDAVTRDLEGNTALHWAVAHRCVESVDILLEAYGQIKNFIDKQNLEGNTALMLAAGCGSQAILTSLINNGADVSLRNEDGNCALLLSAKEGHCSCVTSLIQSGCDVNSVDEVGASALLYTITNRNVVQMLLTAGASPNVMSADGVTPILLAIEMECPQTVQLLIEANCNASFGLRTVQGRHPLQIALYKGLIRITKLIFKSLEIEGASTSWLNSYLADVNVVAEAQRNVNVAHLLSWIKEQLYSYCVRIKLVDFCRRSIRRSVGSSGANDRLQQLPLPNSLINYLMLSDLEDL